MFKGFDHRLAKAVLLAALGVTASAAAGTGLDGLFRSPNKGEGFVHIRIGECQSNAALTCGIIEAAFEADGQKRPDYENIGKLILWDMTSKGGGAYRGGRIWHPLQNKIYRGKLQTIGDDVLKATGCIGFLCKSERWMRIE